MARCGANIFDARGQKRRVPPPGWAMGASFPTRRELELAKMRAELHGAPMRPLRVLITVVIGSILGGLAYALFIRWEGRFAAAGIEAAMFIVLGWLVVWLCVGTPTMRGMHERIHRRLAALRRCLCCGYELEGIPAESDGCTVCPECGAAWRLGGETARGSA